MVFTGFLPLDFLGVPINWAHPVHGDQATLGLQPLVPKASLDRHGFIFIDACTCMYI